MSKTLTVTEISRKFADYINRVVYRGERFVLTRGNRPVAELRPLQVGVKGAELMRILKDGPRLSPSEAGALGNDIDKARKGLGTIGDMSDPWEA